MSKSLSAEVVLLRTKAGTLENVKHLNLWGNDIDNVSILRQMPNLEVVSLSVNKLTSLQDFAHCAKLSELYLRKNCISELSEVKFLGKLRDLKVLWLWDNPCAESVSYRQTVISLLPGLLKLDNQPVTAEERAQASRVRPVQEPAVLREVKQPEVRSVSPQCFKKKESSRHENILCAILALVKELDVAGLELVKRDVDKKLSGR